MTPQGPHHDVGGIAARGPPGIREPACAVHPRCRVTSTCVRGPGHCELPDGRRHRSSVPGCESSSRAVHGTPAGRTTVSKKNFCCVTTRRRNLTVTRYLGHRLGTLTARTFRFGMLRFNFRILAACRLPPRRLPAADLPQALGVLAITLVRTPRLVLTFAAFAQAHPRTRSSWTGTAGALWFIVAAAHGSYTSPKGQPGENWLEFSPGDYQNRNQTDGRQSILPGMNETGKETVLERRGRRKR